jgi:sterol desaturase/sphingolipid hydroxylase (fatty acid hydroxylase superfamily)
MAVEIFYEKIKHKNSYRLNDTLTNINTGTLQQLTNTFIVLFKIGIYTWVYESFAISVLPQNGYTFVLALIFWDFCYYWEHRMAHTVNLFWGGHIVHHQSEEFNLSVALRQTSTGFIWGFPFYLPMAILGINPMQFVLVGGINLLYQFWIHTEHIKKMPWFFELVFNTPSHHRVHHGRDPKYIDKNYAGILIVWDRLFGSFQVEEETPHYGITTPLNSWNPVYANFAHYINLGKWLGHIRSPKDAIKLLLNKPGWFPEYMGGAQPVKTIESGYKKYNKNINGIQGYILFQFFIALVLNSFYFFNFAHFLIFDKIIFALWIVFTALLFGFMFEVQSRFIIGLEILRLLVIPYIVYHIIWPENINSMFSIGLSLALIFFSVVLLYHSIHKSKAINYGQ